jgi:predicted dehydrogenase
MLPIKVAVIGCGFYAQNHLHAWKDLAKKGAALVAVCDLDSEKAKACGNKFDAAWYTDAHAMLSSEEINLVDIVTQMDSHQSLAALAADNGVGAIIQKPLAPNLEVAAEIANYAKNGGTWLAVHENFRFGTSMMRIKDELEANVIGNPRWARISFRTNYDVYAGQPYLKTVPRLIILDLGIHLLDLARFFLGEVDHVHCETQQLRDGIKGEDTATVLLKHKTGSVSVVDVSYESKRVPETFPETLLEIEGSTGSITLSKDQMMTINRGAVVEERYVGSDILPWTSIPWHVSQEAVLNANEHFLDCFKRGANPQTSVSDNLKTFALVEAAYEAATTGRVIRPKYS